MRFLFVALAASVSAQSGAGVFAKSCASGYCHGAKGAGGGAPKLAGRGFDEEYIRQVIRSGVPGTAMQAYGTTLSRPDFAAVVAYVASLNGVKAGVIGGGAPRTLSADAQRGRELFSDPLRGFSRCSTCHEVGVGIPVAPIGRVPEDLGKITAKNVKTVSIDSDRFPGLVVSQGGRRVSVWDLSAVPPVLRSADSGAVSIGGSVEWPHPSFYSAAELEKIGTFLRAAMRRN